MMKTQANKNVRCLMCLAFLFIMSDVFSQGRNSVYLLGYNAKARIDFTSNSYTISPDARQITFNDTQANIADENGNILMSSNGVFIADANGDTMLNGTGLNPGWGVNNCPDGLCMSYANLFLPMPGDTSKYILFHQSAEINSPVGLDALEIYYSVIDLSLNGGLGQVISKNNIALSGVFSWGYAACKHANGRDWWIVAMNDVADGFHTFLVTPDTLQYIGHQAFNVQKYLYGFAGQPLFSPDGTKFAYGGSYGINGMNYLSSIALFNFDRCSGVFSLDTVIDFSDSYISFASAFSPNSQYLYFASSEHLYQYDTNTGGLLPHQLVATNDIFASPNPPFYTNFYLMYLAANGKIYISSGSSVKHLHEMNYPDSAGLACDVQLHNVFTNCFYIGVPNHPNYYLGRLVGSACDTLTSINEIEHDFKFKIFPNPNNGNFKIMYLLPQNKAGRLEIFDINGKVVYSQNLPQWSTLQNISLPKLINGVYNCIIVSGNERTNKKLIIFKE